MCLTANFMISGFRLADEVSATFLTPQRSLAIDETSKGLPRFTSSAALRACDSVPPFSITLSAASKIALLFATSVTDSSASAAVIVLLSLLVDFLPQRWAISDSGAPFIIVSSTSS